LQACAGVVASLLAAAVKAEVKGALATQLQTALDSRVLMKQAKGALMERERLDDQKAFTHLRRAASHRGGSWPRSPARSPVDGCDDREPTV
jgi:AmiR/NasT family two-component response regulator